MATCSMQAMVSGSAAESSGDISRYISSALCWALRASRLGTSHPGGWNGNGVKRCARAMGTRKKCAGLEDRFAAKGKKKNAFPCKLSVMDGEWGSSRHGNPQGCHFLPWCWESHMCLKACEVEVSILPQSGLGLTFCQLFQK